LTQARALFEESLRIHRELGDKAGIAHLLFDLGKLLLRTADYEQAEVLFKESLEIRAGMDDRRGSAECFAFLICTYAAQEPDVRRLRLAALLVGATERLIGAGGFDFYPSDREQYERGSELVRSRSDGVDFQTERARGAALSFGEAVARALGT
jgi:hypothetical protein